MSVMFCFLVNERCRESIGKVALQRLLPMSNLRVKSGALCSLSSAFLTWGLSLWKFQADRLN